MTTVLVAGGASFDSIIHLPSLPESVPQTIRSCIFHETIGSTGTGKAINLSKLGLPTTLHALIGNDIYGEKIKSSMQRENLNFIYDVDSRGTERHMNLMDEAGRRTSIFLTNSTSDPELDLGKFRPLIKDNDLIVLNILNYTKQLIPLCTQYQKPIWTDLHDYDGRNQFYQDYIHAADYIFMSSDNLQDYRAVMVGIMKQGKRLVVCTHGKNGATALNGSGEWTEVPVIESYRMYDANGAGDSFVAGFIYGYSKKYQLKKCLQLATICAGLCITSRELSYDGLSPEFLEQEYRKHYGNG
jgi:sugar/nucleoside kinase (ribokinase family)